MALPPRRNVVQKMCERQENISPAVYLSICLSVCLSVWPTGRLAVHAGACMQPEDLELDSHLNCALCGQDDLKGCCVPGIWTVALFKRAVRSGHAVEIDPEAAKKRAAF